MLVNDGKIYQTALNFDRLDLHRYRDEYGYVVIDDIPKENAEAIEYAKKFNKEWKGYPKETGFDY